MRNKNLILKHFSLLPGLNFSHDFLYILLSSGTGGWGMAVAVSA